jgi:predicted dehydrogenase
MPYPYRVAVIGSTGRGNYGHGLDTVWLHEPRTTIVAVADDDAAGLAAATARLKAPRGYADWRQMIEKEKPHIVAIAPRWIGRHAEMAIFAAERGCHIYMEKPYCRSPQEADAIGAAVKKKDIKLAVAHRTRWSPMMQQVRDLIAGGKIGRVIEMRARGKEDRRGGAEDFWVLGSHMFNLMNHLAGPPRWCSATMLAGDELVARRHLVEGPEELGPIGGDSIRVQYLFDSGIAGCFDSVRDAGGKDYRFGMTIHGSTGVIEMTNESLPDVHWLGDPTWSSARSGKPWVRVSSHGPGEPEILTDKSTTSGNLRAVADLLAAIENDRQPECGPDEAATTIEMICAAFESHRLGRRVALPLETRVNPLTLM